MSLVKPETLPLTFIKPVVSTANVGQLAVDLIIASLALERIAIFAPEYCVPAVGAREGGQQGITTPLERERSRISATSGA